MKKNRLLILAIILFISGFFFITGNGKIEFHKLDSYTKIWEKDSEIFEVYVVVNPPNNLDDFKSEVLNFNSKHGKNKHFRVNKRLFIKEHPQSFVNKFWGEKTEYLKKTPAEIDNIDFLCQTLWYKQINGKDTVEYNYYTDLGRFYAE